MLTSDHINFTALRFFIKAAECGNITQAANELYVTQPVLSRYIKELEKEAEVTLFLRQKYGVELTEEGRRFYAYAKELESSLDVFCNRVSALNGTHYYNLKIGYQKSAEQLMIAANSAYVERFPEAVIGVVRQEDVNFKEMLRNHLLQIAFNAETEYTQTDEDLSYAALMQVPQMLMVSKSNPLAQRERVHFSELRNEKWILPTPESLPRKRELILQSCRLYNFEPQVISDERQYSNYIIKVVTNNAVAILTRIKEAEITNPQIAFVPLDGFPGVSGIGLMWLSKETNPAIERYVESAREAVRKTQEEAQDITKQI